MDQSGNYLDTAMLEIGKAFRRMKDDGLTFDQLRESAYSINTAVSQFVADVLNKEDPNYNSKE